MSSGPENADVSPGTIQVLEQLSEHLTGKFMKMLSEQEHRLRTELRRPPGETPGQVPSGLPPTTQAVWRGQLERFTGDRHEDVDSFLESAARQFVIHGINDDVIRVNIAVASLGGVALAWYRRAARGNNFEWNWDRFRLALYERFHDRHAPAHIRQQLRGLRQSVHGGLQQYISEFQNLTYRLADMSESEEVNAFINGLLPETCRHLTTFLPNTMDEAIEMAENFDQGLSVMLGSRGQFRGQGQRGRQDQRNLAPMDLGMVERSSRKSLMCYRCGQDGHTARVCPNEIDQERVQQRMGRVGVQGRSRGGKSQRNNSRFVGPRANNTEVVDLEDQQEAPVFEDQH